MTLLKGLQELSGLAVVKINEEDKFPDYLEAYAVDRDYQKPYKKSIIKEVGKSIREKVGKMGEYHSCDYFYLVKTGKKELRGYLIEETNLSRTFSWKKKELMESNRTGINEDFLSEHIGDHLIAENRIKLYSSLLIMCRLCNQFKDIDELLQKVKFYFVLLVLDEESTSGISAPAYMNIEPKLRNKIEGIHIKLAKGQVIHSYKNFKEHIKSLSTPSKY